MRWCFKRSFTTKGDDLYENEEGKLEDEKREKGNGYERKKR